MALVRWDKLFPRFSRPKFRVRPRAMFCHMLPILTTARPEIIMRTEFPLFLTLRSQVPNRMSRLLQVLSRRHFSQSLMATVVMAAPNFFVIICTTSSPTNQHSHRTQRKHSSRALLKLRKLSCAKILCK